MLIVFFFFNDTATTEIYTLSLHDALPIFTHPEDELAGHYFIAEGFSDLRYSKRDFHPSRFLHIQKVHKNTLRSEEHTSELQSRQYLVCRLLLEKKKNTSSHLPSTLSMLFS